MLLSLRRSKRAPVAFSIMSKCLLVGWPLHISAGSKLKWPYQTKVSDTIAVIFQISYLTLWPFWKLTLHNWKSFFVTAEITLAWRASDKEARPSPCLTSIEIWSAYFGLEIYTFLTHQQIPLLLAKNALSCWIIQQLKLLFLQHLVISGFP